MPANTATANPFSFLGETFESASDSFGRAKADARDSAKNAACRTKEVLGDAVYKTSYGISYGIVYGAAFMTQLLSEENAIRRGFIAGADDAIAAREEIEAKKKKKATEPKAQTVKATKKTKASAPKVSPKAKKAIKARADKFDAAK